MGYEAQPSMKTWRERIQEARERGHWLLEDVNDLYEWTTCLVGEQHLRYPEVVVYLPAKGQLKTRPADPVLNRLGSRSMEMTPDEAWEALDNIEDRVLQLKRGDV